MLQDMQFRPVATFSGLRRVPLLALSRNSLFPSLELRPDALNIRVILRHELKFEDIEKIEVAWRLAHQVTLVPKRGFRTFSANFFSREEAERLVVALQQRGVPLDTTALNFVRKDPEAPANEGL